MIIKLKIHANVCLYLCVCMCEGGRAHTDLVIQGPKSTIVNYHFKPVPTAVEGK